MDWKFISDYEHSEIEDLTREIPQLHPVVAELLVQRGLKGMNEVKRFFNPILEELETYGAMKDQEKAAVRLKNAIDQRQKILLYGDYDVDGTCSVAMTYLFLKEVGADVSYYIPDRYKEGYGVSEAGVDFAISNKFDLVITLDCGIAANRTLNRIQSAEIDVIICDHHLPGDQIPKVFAIMNPQQSDCDFDGKELCGCGVALMLLKSISDLLHQKDLWKNYLDYVAVATCCDIVPLRGINRILVHNGLKKMNESRSTGIDALLIAAEYRRNLNVSDVVFKIGPRINAAGRLKHAEMAVNVLIEQNSEKAVALALELDKVNNQRKTLDKQVTEEAAHQMMESDPNLEMNCTVVHHSEWNKGVIGIVASRLIERCYRPTIVLTEKEGMLTGSGRSVEGFNLFEAISNCDEHLEQFGGHAAAAGLTLRRDSLDGFIDAFNRQAANILGESPSRNPALTIDLAVDFSVWYNDKLRIFWDQYCRLMPFGPEHLPPVFATTNCVASGLRVMKDEHLKFDVCQKHDRRRKLSVIAFGMADLYDELAEGNSFDLAYAIEENTWRPGSNKNESENKDDSARANNRPPKIQLQAKSIMFHT
ncbi:MAG: single-stranded-DNA-specific exonuclease RecJ [Cryomorphaceae bacterium]